MLWSCYVYAFPPSMAIAVRLIHDVQNAVGWSAGLPSQSIMWGPWATGMAASDARIAARFAKAGLRLISPVAGLQLLTCAMAVMTQHGTITAAPIAWPQLLAALRPAPAMLSDFQTADSPLPHAAAAGVTTVAANRMSQDEIYTSVAAVVQAMLGVEVPSQQVICCFSSIPCKI